jgi:small subunit ribosomal protein S4
MKKLRLNHSNINYFNAIFQPPYKNPAHLKKVLKDYYQVPAPLLKGTMAQILLKLEQRVDVLLVRSHLATSLAQSRQLINHRFVKVNGKVVRFQGRMLKPNDILEITMKIVPVSNLLWTKALPSYLEVDYALQTAIYLREPQLEELSVPFAIDSSTPIA